MKCEKLEIKSNSEKQILNPNCKKKYLTDEKYFKKKILESSK